MGQISMLNSDPVLAINHEAVLHNLQRVKTLAPQSKIIAMVKANAYGHGMLGISQVLSVGGVDALGVARVSEALRILQAGIETPLVLMDGFLDTSELTIISERQWQVVLHHPVQIKMLLSTPLHTPIQVWLKVETGMNRLGFPPERIKQIWQDLEACDWVAPECRLMTHFACADDPSHPLTQKQIDRFQLCVQDLNATLSLANSAGILAWPGSHADWVRPGLMLYGVSPLVNSLGRDHDLIPAMQLSSKLMAVNQVAKGETIGYGASWTAPETMPVGVVAVGYGDGYPWRTPAGTPVLLRDQIVPVVGRVSMDMITVDLRTMPKAKVGDHVVLWGPDLPVEVLAKNVQTSPYEILTRIPQRLYVT